jgi:hypothetical protein
MSPPAFSCGPSILFVTHMPLPSVPASGVSKTQAFFPGCCSPHPGPHPPGLLPHLLLWLGVFWGARSCRGVPMLYLREPLCASCHGPRPRTWHLPVYTQHLSVFHRKNLLELSSQAWCGGAVRFPSEPGAHLGHTRTLMSAGPTERSARGHSWDTRRPHRVGPAPARRCSFPPGRMTDMNSFLPGQEPPLQMSWKVPDAWGRWWRWMLLRVVSSPGERRAPRPPEMRPLEL